MSETFHIFDRAAVRAHRERSLLGDEGAGFLFREAAKRLAERLDDVRRAFPIALDLGCRDGAMGRALSGRGGIERLIRADISPLCVKRVCEDSGDAGVVADAEWLPFASATFDLVTSGLELHWVDDLPGALLHVRRVLKPDGLFLATLFGRETLTELRHALTEAEIEIEGGAAPRVSPFADVRDLGGLLQRAGFALPVVDRDRLTLTYADAFALMRDLRAMGETNALLERRRAFTRRATLLRAAAILGERFAGADGRLRITFEIVYLTAWAPHSSQQRALRPGAPARPLAKALGTDEGAPRRHPAGPSKGTDSNGTRPPDGGGDPH